jgi:murein DD-endopeptidase MepM/ murein hydrolase activator NlpD
MHPISNSYRPHTGTDIGAPLGTPVLAAYAGEVAVADWQGGYGLMVSLLHEEGKQESRYAHLSEIYVQPGQWVEQGTVIGRVGSTGYSTGPHLHFEWRHLTPDGWVAVDAGLHLEYALENLVRSLQVARETAQPQG